MGYWIWWALLSLLQGQRLIYHWAFGDLKKKKRNKFTGSMRLETSLELGDEWKLTVLCVMNFHIHCGLASKESACSVEDLGSITRLGRSPGEGKGCSLQCSGLENSLDCIVHGVAKSRTWLSNFHFHVSLTTFNLGTTQSQVLFFEFYKGGNQSSVKVT